MREQRTRYRDGDCLIDSLFVAETELHPRRSNVIPPSGLKREIQTQQLGAKKWSSAREIGEAWDYANAKGCETLWFADDGCP